MRTIEGYDGLQELVGQELGASDWLEVTQDRVDGFAEATGDRQWIHVDAERAKAGPFGAPIAHGFLTLSLIPVLGAEVVDVTGMKMKINYGCNKVRFTQPVKVGARVRDVVSLVSADRKDSGIQVVMRHTIEIEGEERPGCVAETVTIMVEDAAKS